ncbi:MAG: Sulfur carrier protein DsrE2 [Anaerolineae bacterium]|mgnify:CR=1 FL=1|nr:Sulfur carrier protein DsrE2 [Anaerolineae bacterium]
MSDNGERKLSIICSKGTLDMAYPGLVLANAALMEGIDVTMFFTFWGLEIVKRKSMDHLKATPLGNPAMGMPNIVGILPGVTAMASTMMKKEIEKLDFPPVSEFVEMIHDAGGKMYGCRMAMDMMKLEKEDLCDQIDDVIGAMEFMEMSDGAQIIFI